MFAGSAKGFHIHPPSVPEGERPGEWFQKLFIDEPENYGARRYGHEQWDLMFFVQGRIELLLVDEREGLERRAMRLNIDGDDHPGGNNVAVIVPPGVAHALRSISSTDVVMVYGTSTVFEPLWEGRMAHGIESNELPADWQSYLDAGSGD